MLPDFFRYLSTEPTARSFLSESYRNLGEKYADKLAFQQSTRLLYTVKLADNCYETASSCDRLLQPLLLFYGCTHLLKALLLCRDPAYPQNSRLLQHGVTSRKVKRLPYHLLDDEVRPQKEGLFSHAVKLLGLPVQHERYTMRDLFSSIPELAADYTAIVQKSSWLSLHYEPQKGILSFPPSEQGSVRYSPQTFLDYVQRFSPDPFQFSLSSLPSEWSEGQCVQSAFTSKANLEEHPLFARSSQDYFYWNDTEKVPPVPSWAVHFLILYMLGMLSRYEAEIWGDFVFSHSYSEMVLVEKFFTTHLQTFPSEIASLMNKSTVRR
ncbi:MAG: YaaC family protein [Clostridia bacterium]